MDPLFCFTCLEPIQVIAQYLKMYRTQIDNFRDWDKKFDGTHIV
jgi:hypothetical protein